MVRDRGLMRLAANVGGLCRSYPATLPLLGAFLRKYRELLDTYGSAETARTSALVADLNEVAEDGLDRHRARTRRERSR